MDVQGSRSLSLPDYRKLKIAALFAGVAVAAFGAGLWLAMFMSPSTVSVPDAIKRQVDFSLYVPQKMPGTFVINKNSFSVQEEAVIFKANDDTGAAISFTEQKRPPQFNFDDFYNGQMKNSKVLDGVPFSTVIGKTQNEEVTLISIVTDDMWMLVSSRTPLSEESAKTISQSLKKS